MSFEQQLQQNLAKIKKQARYRFRQTITSSEGVNVIIEGNKLLSFCSNDYLGLANNPHIKKAFQQGIERYGVGSGASHLISGHSAAHHELEEKLAEFVNRPKALLFSTGYMANLGVITALTKRHDTIVADKLNHASLTDAALLSKGKLLRYPHKNLALMEKQLKSASGNILLSTDTVFSMDGDIAPLPEILNIAADYKNTLLLADDAHGFGILGEQGKGTLNHFGINDDSTILMATLGKACGVFAAFVAGSEALIETLIHHANAYIYTTATPPALAHATITALQLVANADAQRAHLKQLIHYFRQCIQQMGISLPLSNTPIQPLILGSNRAALRLSEQLFAAKILVSAIRPPTVPVNHSRLRITLSAAHQFEDIDRLVDCLDKNLDR